MGQGHERPVVGRYLPYTRGRGTVYAWGCDVMVPVRVPLSAIFSTRSTNIYGTNMPTIIRGNLRQSGLEMHDGHTSAPPYTFGSSLDSGMFYANGVGFAANGVHAMTISPTGVDVSGVLSGNAAGLTSIQAANVVGLTDALDTIDATSVTANIFVGNGSGLSDLQAANVLGLTEALDTIDATSVTADSVTIASAQPVLELDALSTGQYTGSKIVLTNNATPTTQKNVTMGTFIRDALGENSYFSIDQISNVNSYEKTLARYDLTDQLWSLLTNNTERLRLDSNGASVSGTLSVSNLSSTSNITVDAHLLPSANVTKDLGSADFKWRDLYLSSGTQFLGDATIRESGGSLIVPNITANVVSVTGNISAGKFVGDGSALTGISIPPSINTITITDSSWNPIDDLALSTTSTGYVTIEGNNFEPVGTTVSVGGTAAASVSLVGGTQLRVSVNPKTTGTYDLVVQTGAGYAIKVNAVSFDPIPIWQTGTSLGDVYGGTPFSITLAASDGGSSITYANTTALPPSTTLATNGTLSGTITQPSSTTYNFSVEAIDAQLQSAALRTFSLNFFLLDGSTSARAAASAAAIKDSTGTTTDGVYWIIHNGSPLQVYCDMNFDGGGWMMVTRNTTNSWGWNVWGSNSDLEYASNNNDFYSNMRRNRSYTAVMFKWSGNQVSYAASSSSLKDVTGGVYPRRTGTSLPTSGLGALGTRNENYLYQRISCPVHRGYVFSNYLNNSQNQGGFMEWCGQYANTSSFINLGEIYIR